MYIIRENGRGVFKTSNLKFTFERYTPGSSRGPQARGPQAHDNVPVPLFPVKLDYASLKTYRESLSGYYGKAHSGQSVPSERVCSKTCDLVSKKRNR
jgi:hypothetical protein